MDIYINANFLTKPVTGLERYALELSLAMQNYQNDLIFLAPARDFPKSNYDLGRLNIRTVGMTKNYLWEQTELPSYLMRKKNPLLINLTNTAPFIYKNQVIVIHDLAFIHNPAWYSKRAVLFFKWIVRKSAEASKHIITVSNFSKNEIQKYFNIPSGRISVIPEGIASSLIALYKKDYANPWGNYILTVATLEPRKNLLNLIKAFLASGLDEYKLLIAGGSNRLVFNNPEIEEFRREKRIVFLGHVSDSILAGLYKNARLFTYISHYEGFGLPPLEALAGGCPVLASGIGSLKEILGDFAEYCNPDDVRETSGMMKKMISEGREIGISEIMEISRKYNWENSASLFLNAIGEIRGNDTGIK